MLPHLTIPGLPPWARFCRPYGALNTCDVLGPDARHLRCGLAAGLWLLAGLPPWDRFCRPRRPPHQTRLLCSARDLLALGRRAMGTPAAGLRIFATCSVPRRVTRDAESLLRGLGCLQGALQR